MYESCDGVSDDIRYLEDVSVTGPFLWFCLSGIMTDQWFKAKCTEQVIYYKCEKVYHTITILSPVLAHMYAVHG